MKQVYRLETQQGEGVFMNGGHHHYSDHAQDDPGRMPSPHEDGLQITPTYHCGFDSMEQMLEWFSEPEHYHHLDTAKILVRLYEVEDEHVKHGGHQDIFVRHLATIVAEEKPSQFASKLYNLL